MLFCGLEFGGGDKRNTEQEYNAFHLRKSKKEIELNGEFIRLGDLLKAAGFTGTGGEAKQAVQDGLVNVDGKVCTERGHKIRAGQKVQFKDQTIEVVEQAK